MIDRCGRNIDYLRISVTDRCNLRCIYCMPEKGIRLTEREKILQEPEILRVCQVMAELGIKKIKITGGEPLVRPRIPGLIGQIKAIPGIEKVTLTTNGILLKEQMQDLAAAELDSQVVVETYVQAKQSWWEDQATVYTQDKDGAYFLYNMACSQEDYDKLTKGTKIKVTGYKSEWSGEVEITDATFEIEDGNYVAEAQDLTDLLGSDDLIKHQNEFVAFKGLTVEDAGNGSAFMYGWDGSGSEGDDLYFNVSVNGQTYTFTVESYLCDSTTEVYSAVKNLQIGDVIDTEGFLYWYEGVNPHITSVTVK